MTGSLINDVKSYYYAIFHAWNSDVVDSDKKVTILLH